MEQNSVQKELKSKPMTKPYYLPSPQYTPSYDNDAFTQVLTDTLVQPSSPEEKECLKEEQNKEEEHNKREDKDLEADYDSNDMVNILRAEYV